MPDYEYDALDRITKSSTAGSLKQPAVVQLYDYDNNSNRKSLNDKSLKLILNHKTIMYG